MPQIRQYTAPVDRLQPSDRGVEANTMAGRRIGGFYNQAAGEISDAARAEATAASDVARSVGEVGGAVVTAAKGAEDYLDRQAISKGAAEGERMFAGLKSAWNDTVKESAKRDPNDPTVAAKFREEVLEPQLEQFKTAFGSTPGAQQWAESYTQRVRHHMFESTASDMATLAGVAATKNINDLKTTASNTAHSSPDFHTAGFLLGNVDAQVNAIIDASPNLKGTKAEQLRSELTQDMRQSIVKAGAVGAIARSGDPEKTAEEWTKRYPDILNGADAKTLAGNARQQIRAARVDENYRRHNDDLEKKRVSEATESDILKLVYSDDPKEAAKVSSRSIVNDDRLSNPTKEKLIRLVDREMKPESDAKVSAATSRDLFERIYLPSGDPNKITDTGPIIEARVAGKLTKSDFNDLRAEIANARTPEGEKLGSDRQEFFKRYAATVDGAMDMGGHSALGSQRIYQFEMEARRQELDLRKKGQDPHSLYDPSSPNFLGKQVAKYHVSFQEAQAFEKQIQGERKSVPPPPGTPPAKEIIVTTKEQYDGLPSGTDFTSNGKKFRKP